jgi:hypothetical protein
MSITSFSSNISKSAIAGKEITLTWVTTGSSVTLNCDCYDGTQKQTAGTALSASTSVYIYPVGSLEVVLTDDSGNTESEFIEVGYDPSTSILMGGRLRKIGE